MNNYRSWISRIPDLIEAGFDLRVLSFMGYVENCMLSRRTQLDFPLDDYIEECEDPARMLQMTLEDTHIPVPGYREHHEWFFLGQGYCNPFAKELRSLEEVKGS